MPDEELRRLVELRAEAAVCPAGAQPPEQTKTRNALEFFAKALTGSPE